MQVTLDSLILASPVFYFCVIVSAVLGYLVGKSST